MCVCCIHQRTYVYMLCYTYMYVTDLDTLGGVAQVERVVKAGHAVVPHLRDLFFDVMVLDRSLDASKYTTYTTLYHIIHICRCVLASNYTMHTRINIHTYFKLNRTDLEHLTELVGIARQEVEEAEALEVLGALVGHLHHLHTIG